jgi:hypothetical protein
MRGLFISGLHLKDPIEVSELEQPSEAPRRVDEDKPVPSGCAPSVRGHEGAKSAQIDKGHTCTVDQNVTGGIRQLHLELWRRGQVELSGQDDLVGSHGDGRRWQQRKHVALPAVPVSAAGVNEKPDQPNNCQHGGDPPQDMDSKTHAKEDQSQQSHQNDGHHTRLPAA